MNDKNKDVPVPGHEYDGIVELNNAAPFWWQLFFYISIVWGVGYAVYFLWLGGPTLDQELAAEMSVIREKQEASAPKGASESDLNAALADVARVNSGAAVYAEKCMPCHAADGGGTVGPNLTDNYWIHDKGTLTAIYNVVKNGVLDKGMPEWASQMSENDIVNVSVFVKSLKGKKVEVAKEPQGELVND